ncbi:hypothetical protein LCGC14_2377260 [marine sediment metagenome]|uniref:Helix-turn-helix domain-containing protein n=1 Tax=marine sediment metagenome TaxID=412755 RepID=A0A0F9EWP7_9ZZZZ
MPKEPNALSVIETASRLGLSKDAVKRRIGTELVGYKDPLTGWWMIRLSSIKRWEVQKKAEIAAAKADTA